MFIFLITEFQCCRLWQKIISNIVTLPLWPPCYINFFKPFHFTAGDQLVVPIGVSHISLRLQEIQSREREEKKEQTNNMLGLTQVQKRSYVILCMCRLTLAWVTSENSTTLLECRLIFSHCGWTLSHADWSLCCPMSTGHSHHPSPTAFLAPFSNSLLASPYHFRSRPKPFVWFCAKTDKGIVCLADHLHSVTISMLIM